MLQQELESHRFDISSNILKWYRHILGKNKKKKICRVNWYYRDIMVSIVKPASCIIHKDN